MGLSVVACGGSASETPFPLEPDRATLRSSQTARAEGTPLPGAGETDPDEEDVSEPLEPEEAKSTWGGPPPRPRVRPLEELPVGKPPVGKPPAGKPPAGKPPAGAKPPPGQLELEDDE